MENLTALVQEEQIKGAWLSGLGAAMWAELGFFNLEDKTYEWKKLDQVLEIISLEGNIAWEDPLTAGAEPVIHIHGVFSNRDMNSFGGHVKELEVAGTCEILLHRWYQGGLRRELDDETGLKLLEL